MQLSCLILRCIKSLYGVLYRHPDRTRRSGAEEKFIEINKAYEVFILINSTIKSYREQQ